MSNLDDATSKLGEAYRSWKRLEKEKDAAKREFFELATTELGSELPEQSVEHVEAETEEEALRIAQRLFHRHLVKDVREDEEGWHVILEEDPELREFTYINRSDGYVYKRSISEGAPSLDDQGLAQEQPELWEAITHEITRRELRPLEDLTPEQVQALRPYLTMPRPQPRLIAPRKAKPEEMDVD
jgi:hypothetical protein